MGRTLPFTISAFRHFYAKDGPEAKLTIRDVNNFRDICKEGMEGDRNEELRLRIRRHGRLRKRDGEDQAHDD